MSRLVFNAGAAVLLALMQGCTTPEANVTSDLAQASCCVCVYNNDLACVDVRVRDATPRTEYAGNTYYFCSEDCRKSFERKPQKYLVARQLTGTEGDKNNAAD